MANLNASLVAYKGHFSRAEKEMDRVVTFVRDNPTPRGEAEMEEGLTKLKKFGSKIEDICVQKMEQEIAQQEQGMLNATLDDVTQRISKATTVMLRVIQIIHRNAQEVLTVRREGDHGANKPKVCEVLRPFKLKADHTPNDLRSWLEKIQAFFSTSKLELYTVAEQHVFFFSCVTVPLETKIREHDLYRQDMEVFGADSLQAIVEAEFALRYPLFNRRLDFFRIQQANGQMFTDFMLKLKQKGEEADLGQLGVEQLYIFRYITGVTDVKLRERFLKLQNPSLEDLKREARTYEVGTQAAKAMDRNSARIAKIDNKFNKSGQRRESNKSKNRKPERFKGMCHRCGSKEHMANSCNKTKESLHCKSCKKWGHIEKVCYSKQYKPKSSSASRINSRAPSPETEEDAAISSHVLCKGVNSANRPTPKLQLELSSVNGTTRTFSFGVTPDTGATRSVVARNILSRYNIEPFSSHSRLFAANGEEMQCNGSVKLRVSKSKHIINALVSSDIKDEILISWHDLQAIGVISQDFPSKIRKVDSLMITEDLKKSFPDVLNDDLTPGEMMSGPPMKIHLRKDVKITPNMQSVTRKIPIHLQESANKVVDELIRNGILKQVDVPTEWISPGHFVPKPKGGVRLVTDYTHLNQFVMRPIHPFPSSLDILQNIHPRSTWFAKLDAVQGYFQIPLDEGSSLLTTFLLPTGRYRYTRAPMGLNASGDEWCRRSDLALQGLTGVKKLVDDILVEGETLEQLQDRIRNVLQRCRKHNIRLSLKKFEIGRKVSFAGHIISEGNVKPDPSKVEAITKFRAPKDVTELRSFLGLANQLGHFIPDLTHSTKEIRKLLKKNTTFQWLPVHDDEFQRVKSILTCDLIMQPFDSSLRTELLTDASRLHGLGFCLIQINNDNTKRLIQCGSCSLTDAQTRYATIELECLAVQWAIDKCKFWLQGMPYFLVITDHRPLLGVFKKQLHEIENPRLQRMRGKLIGYNFQLEWQAGKEHIIADTLSRSPVWPADKQDVNNVIDDSHLRQTYSSTNLDKELEIFCEAAVHDPKYQQLLRAIENGVNFKCLQQDHIAKQYKGVWERLSILQANPSNLAVLDGIRIIVPEAVRRETLQLLHSSHQGIVKTKQCARQHYYWPGITAAIITTVEACRACNQFLPSQPEETIKPPIQPHEPMEQVSADLASVHGKDYLVLVDRFSGYLFVDKLRGQSTEDVIKCLQKWFLQFGWPSTIRTDGGPCFRSKFLEFCKTNRITHELSSAYNPQSNGLAEAGVKNAKRLLAKCFELEEDFPTALLNFQLTPRSDGHCPADLFYKRRLKGSLPSIPRHISPEEGLIARQNASEASRNTHKGHDLPKLQKGQTIHVQNPKTRQWSPDYKVVSVRENGRSYKVEGPDGGLYTRNRKFIRPQAKKDETGETGRKNKNEPANLLMPRRSERIKKKSVHFEF